MSVIRFIECPEMEATHVKIVKDRNKHYEKCNLKPGKIYEVERNTEDEFMGEELILSEGGSYIFSFSLFIKVIWLKEPFVV